MTEDLSRDTQQQIEKMVERVARKAGYTGRGSMSYQQILQEKFEQKKEKVRRKYDKYRTKLGLKKPSTDFSEEVKTYLQDGLLDLMKEGRSEAEALRLTLEKFDEAELAESFDDFVDAFGGFGMNDIWTAQWVAENGEAAGLFYAAFTVLGLTVGGFLGWLLGHSLLNVGIGLSVGLFLGVGLGLLSNAILALVSHSKTT